MYQINFSSVVPIYEQILRQAQYFIANGALQEGALIPSVRETTKALAINPQTVVKAYMRLKNDGLIRPLRGQGFVVSTGAQERCRSVCLAFFQERLEETLREAAIGGMTSDVIKDCFERAFKKLDSIRQTEEDVDDSKGGM